MVIRLLWAKRVLVVEEDKAGVAQVDEHVRVSIPVDILEAERDRRQALIGLDEHWYHVDMGLSGISCGQFVHHHLPTLSEGRSE